MKAFLNVLAAAVIVLGVMIIALLAFADSRGIISVEGYEHGVAFCGEEFTMVAHSMNAHTWYDNVNDITFVVNSGHKQDKEVKELMDLATVECAKLKQETENG